MSSYDPYGSRNQRGNTYPPPQQYPDQADNAYYSYENNQPHQSYDQAGYGYQDTTYAPGYKDEPAQSGVNVSKERETNVFDGDTYTSSRRASEPKTSRAMRRWRYEHQGNLWTAGSRVRCCGRFFCCTILLFLFFLISIVLSLLLWIRPPNVEIGSIDLVTSGSPIQLESDGISVNLEIPVSVNNPNYFSVTFDHIDASIFYPINNTDIGGGNVQGLKIGSNEQTNFTVPFSLNYTTAIDPNFKILSDIATHCGFGGGSTSDITVNYAIHLDFKVFFIPIKPTIRNSASFKCPFTSDDLGALLKQAGINLPDLSQLLNAVL